MKWEIRRMWGIKNVDVVLVVVRALGSVTKKLEKLIEKLNSLLYPIQISQG